MDLSPAQKFPLHSEVQVDYVVTCAFAETKACNFRGCPRKSQARSATFQGWPELLAATSAAPRAAGTVSQRALGQGTCTYRQFLNPGGIRPLRHHVAVSTCSEILTHMRNLKLFENIKITGLSHSSQSPALVVASSRGLWQEHQQPGKGWAIPPATQPAGSWQSAFRPDPHILSVPEKES